MSISFSGIRDKATLVASSLTFGTDEGKIRCDNQNAFAPCGLERCHEPPQRAGRALEIRNASPGSAHGRVAADEDHIFEKCVKERPLSAPC